MRWISGCKSQGLDGGKHRTKYFVIQSTLKNHTNLPNFSPGPAGPLIFGLCLLPAGLRPAPAGRQALLPDF
jgi:hypothetical protein